MRSRQVVVGVIKGSASVSLGSTGFQVRCVDEMCLYVCMYVYTYTYANTRLRCLSKMRGRELTCNGVELSARFSHETFVFASIICCKLCIYASKKTCFFTINIKKCQSFIAKFSSFKNNYERL